MQATLSPVQSLPSDAAIRQRYRVEMPDPTTHLFEVELEILQIQVPFTLKMPVWTPGSYLVREYARHLQDFSLQDFSLQGEVSSPLSWSQLSKNTWQVYALPQSGEGSPPLPPDLRVQSPDLKVDVRIRYRVYAAELTVRTNHLDSSHGYFNGAALFLYVPERRSEPLTLTLVPPHPDWRVATALAPLKTGDPGAPSQSLTYWAQDYDELVDSPVEIGQHRSVTQEILGKPHQWMVWGDGNLELEQWVQDTAKIVATTAEFWGDLPYSHYVFLLHLSPDGFGGLEHRSSTSLIYNRFGFQPQESYDRFLALVAHEFFHTWNVKRLRPAALERFDYDRETYINCLWFCEGATSYYESIILLRARLITPSTFLKLLGQQITRLQLTPGRKIQSLSNSSFDTWVKLYRPHENSLNAQVSYYLKGSIVCACLDLEIRLRSQGRNSLDTALQDLWSRFGRWEKGYSDADLQTAFENAAGGSLAEFFGLYIHGTAELDYNSWLNAFGLRLTPGFSQSNPVPYLGIRVSSDNGLAKITGVEMGSPAQHAGLWAGDELLALQGFKVTASSWSERLKKYAPGQSISVTVFQREELKTVVVQLADPLPDLYTVESLPDPSPTQRQRFQEWLGS